MSLNLRWLLRSPGAQPFMPIDRTSLLPWNTLAGLRTNVCFTTVPSFKIFYKLRNIQYNWGKKWCAKLVHSGIKFDTKVDWWAGVIDTLVIFVGVDLFAGPSDFGALRWSLLLPCSDLKKIKNFRLCTLQVTTRSPHKLNSLIYL